MAEERKVAQQRDLKVNDTSFEISPIYYNESESIPTRCKGVFAALLLVLAVSLVGVGMHFKGRSAAYSFFFMLLGIAALVPGGYLAFAYMREWVSGERTETQAILRGPSSSVG
jgi:hypothetical protein